MIFDVFGMIAWEGMNGEAAGLKQLVVRVVFFHVYIRA